MCAVRGQQPGDEGVVGAVSNPVEEDAPGDPSSRCQLQGVEVRADRSAEDSPGVLERERRDDGLDGHLGVCGPGSLPPGGRLPGSLACGQRSEEEGVADSKPRRDRRVRRNARPQTSDKGAIPGDVIARVRTVINTYNHCLDNQKDEAKMYDLQYSLEIARACILEIETLLQVRR